ncbi:MAG: bifunctional biotin--[acetyl-CoA-carboxylase] ligase/biotin operon repressor BirA [Gammaproteobacteria bacterium]
MKKLSPNFIKLTALLNDLEYHDGTTIGEALNITRSAVWKVIKKLENYGIEIDSVKGKGYALREPLILLDKHFIAKNLNNKDILIEIYETIDSTNAYLKAFYNSSKPKICLAEYQTKGRGRLQRNWHSPFGQNIYFSCLYPFQKDISELAGLSLVVSLAIVRALTIYKLPAPLFVKWPNDVVYQNKKLAGCLLEIQAETNGMCSVVIGIGINANMSHDKHHAITQPWTSLKTILNTTVDRNPLCVSLMNNLMFYLKQFEVKGLLSFIDEWQRVDSLANQSIHLKHINHTIMGRVKGINQHGHLILTLTDGTVRTFSSGDTTIIKY